ncbi:MAG: hypothetical protein D6732_18235 [Methanobacteriota archaeon]|nr:MAG: hypothetical protein D6732_18235 [Euryarchaeota archaeon]
MIGNVSNDKGSALITAILISLIITATVGIALTAYSLHRRLIYGKVFFLQAKYLAESGIHHVLVNLQKNWETESRKGYWRQHISITAKDSVDVVRFPWGGYIHVEAVAQKKHQRYTLRTLVGEQPSSVFDYGVVINPAYYSLVVTGDTRLYCDVLVGKSGVKKETFRGRPYTGTQSVYGHITKTREDRRPAVATNYIRFIIAQFGEELNSVDTVPLEKIVSDTSATVSLNTEEGFRNVYVTNDLLNQRNWSIRGPGILIADEPLTIHTKLRITNYVKVLCSGPIIVEGGGSYEEVIFYSPKQIVLSGVPYFRGQLFSESGIRVKNHSRLHYPSIVLTYSNDDTSTIQLLKGSEITGTVMYVTRNRLPIPSTQRGKILIDEGAVVNGFVYSDNLVTLKGTVNGAVITDRFHFYYSPTDYYNWIKDGVVNRNKLTRYISLPLLFDLPKKHLRKVVLQP